MYNVYIHALYTYVCILFASTQSRIYSLYAEGAPISYIHTYIHTYIRTCVHSIWVLVLGPIVYGYMGPTQLPETANDATHGYKWQVLTLASYFRLKKTRASGRNVGKVLTLFLKLVSENYLFLIWILFFIKVPNTFIWLGAFVRTYIWFGLQEVWIGWVIPVSTDCRHCMSEG